MANQACQRTTRNIYVQQFAAARGQPNRRNYLDSLAIKRDLVCQKKTVVNLASSANMFTVILVVVGCLVGH